MEQAGKLLLIAGLVLIVLGGLFLLGSRFSFNWKLPGDIVIHRENFSFYFPITTSIVVSILLSLVFWLISHFRN